MIRAFMIAWVLFAFLGCSGQEGSESSAVTEDLRAKDYVPAESYFKDSELDAWYELVHKLAAEFDEVCGDTFCEGDYANLQHLSFQCSVSSSDGTLGSCVWTFAGSTEDITPSTGTVRVKVASFKCKAPLEPETKAADFLSALTGAPEALRAPLPGAEKSLYDGLVDCL